MAKEGRRPWWSVRISAIVSLLLIAAGCIALVGSALLTVSWVSNHWITKRERKAAIAALDAIDDLRTNRYTDGKNYAADNRNVKSVVNKCFEEQFTEADRMIANLVDLQLGVVEVHQSNDLAPKAPANYKQPILNHSAVPDMQPSMDRFMALEEAALRKKLSEKRFWE